MKKVILVFSIILVGYIYEVYSHLYKTFPFNTLKEAKYKYFTKKEKPLKWNNQFKVVDIKSSLDGTIQKAYAYFSTKSNQPLIVKLHTWSGDYSQKNIIAKLAKENNWNYIQPDARGANKSFNSCLSDLVISDIDDSIEFMIKNNNVDKNNIFIIGESGGGYTALGMYAKSKNKIKKYYVWVPISNLVSWYNEMKNRLNSGISKHLYYKDILMCTDKSVDEINYIKKSLNINEAKKRSPIFYSISKDRYNNSKISIYAGLYDGYLGAVPISHSLQYYNHILTSIGHKQYDDFVSKTDINNLLSLNVNIKVDRKIGSRKIIFYKSIKNAEITIFEGKHEILNDYVIEDIKKEIKY